MTRSRHAAPFLALAAAVVLACGGIVAGRPDGWTRVTVLDVGQGDAILIEGSSGGRVLVDGGPDPDRLRVLLDARLPAWDRRLDVVVLTHPHEDHAAGLVGLVGRYRIGRFFEPGMAGPGPGYIALAGLLDRYDQPRGRLSSGDRFTIDDGHFRVLWPDPGSVPATAPEDGKSINNLSIVLELTVGRRRFLLMGDAEQEIDPILLARGLRHADALKVAHHGSGTATTAAFLAAVRPTVAAFSAGTRNRYGHPARATIARLEDTAARIFRTDRDGSVTVATDGDGLRVTARREARLPRGPGQRVATGRSHAPSPALIGDAGVLVYDRADGRPGARRGRLHPSRTRSARVVRASFGRRGRGRLVPRRTSGGPRPQPRSPPRRSGRPAPRRGQAAPRRRSRSPPVPRARLGRVVEAKRIRRTGGGGRLAPSDPPPRQRHESPGGRRSRDDDRGLRRQAGRPAPGAHGPPIRRLAAALSRFVVKR